MAIAWTSLQEPRFVLNQVMPRRLLLSRSLATGSFMVAIALLPAKLTSLVPTKFPRDYSKLDLATSRNRRQIVAC